VHGRVLRWTPPVVWHHRVISYGDSTTRNRRENLDFCYQALDFQS
jgi:hypothetical protein